MESYRTSQAYDKTSFRCISNTCAVQFALLASWHPCKPLQGRTGGPPPRTLPEQIALSTHAQPNHTPCTNLKTPRFHAMPIAPKRLQITSQRFTANPTAGNRTASHFIDYWPSKATSYQETSGRYPLWPNVPHMEYVPDSSADPLADTTFTLA